MFYAGIILSNKALHLHTILEVFATNIFNFRKCPLWSVNENQFERQKLCLHIRASKDHRRNNTESATGQNNIKEILNFIICTAYILHVLQ